MNRVIELDELPTTITTGTTNLMVVQIRVNHEWVDYASIKDTDDLITARRMLRTHPETYRVFGRLPALA